MHFIKNRPKALSVFLVGALTAVLTLATSTAEIPDGKTSYEINCMACHQVDAQTVGPSLIRIAAVYPKEKQPEFLRWTKEPGKKDPVAIQMPSMAHLPDETLASIHDYILKVVIGKKEKKGSPIFAKYRVPKRTLPYVFRGFFPDSSPASVGIVLPGNLSICWDTELCRVRYALRSSKTTIGGRRKESKFDKVPFHLEVPETPLLVADQTKLQYLGYQLINGYPEFRYKSGDMEVRELVSNQSTPKGFNRIFKIIGATSDLVFDLEHEGTTTFSSNQGTINDGKLTLSSEQATNFTLTVTHQ